jgi:predicted nucleic acid-binding protein
MACRLSTRVRLALLDVDHPGVIELALSTGLTAYDASSLWLAGTHGAKLVTLDAWLEQAAARLRR